jgi:Vacuolar segregation subunit 7
MMTVGFVFQTSRSLEGVEVRNVTNIVVSQEELVMDILIDAGNPNILPVTAGDILNIDIFARSEHFQPPPTPQRREVTRGLPFWPPSTKPPAEKPHNVTEGTSLLLGTIHALEAPIAFPPTSFKRESFTTQKGQMKLVGPAVNATDGPEKWKRAISFNFELIVRGTVRYRAPIGGRERAVAVEWRGTVDPLGNRVWNGEEWEDSE